MQFIIILLLLILAIVVAIGVGFMSYWPMYGAPYVPTQNKEIEDIFKKIKLRKGQIFCDIGCGDGRMVMAATKITKTKAYGIDINWGLIQWCKFKANLIKNKLARFKSINFYKQQLPKADVYYIYLWPKIVDEIIYKLKSSNNITIICKSFEATQFKYQSAFKLGNSRFWVYKFA